ncbi:MAG TPA: alpha/beta hydrolase, partial [Ramlibacter sp.]|nr:alpha/beta hydrolase [Ramlibacter sp.]
MTGYRAPWWLPGGNLQTIWPALVSRRTFGPAPHYRRERWTTPDGDFVDLDWLEDESSTLAGLAPGGPSLRPGATRALLVLFHGLEGSSRSHYAEAFADFAAQQGIAFVVPHFRGCSGEINLAPRAYHSGDHEEIGWILAQLRERHAGPIVGVGVSLG